MMETKYQVFVSSTFRDLKDARQIVLRALLEMGHMPAGMELFPATDDDAWELIQTVIDESDYYLLVVGGRYGSEDAEGIGFTEKEYDYAVKSQKPVIAFLHENPEKLPRENTETDDAVWEKLEAFRKKIESNHHCKYWNQPSDLHASVVISLTALVKKNKATGWIRANQLPVDFSVEEMLRLQARVRELEDAIDSNRNEPPAGSEEFAQGEDEHSIPFTAEITVELNEKNKWGQSESRSLKIASAIEVTWNELFAGMAPSLIQEARDYVLRTKMRDVLFNLTAPKVRLAAEKREGVVRAWDIGKHDIKFAEEDIETCMVQFRALGLIQESKRKRSITDTSTYWSLTSYGDSVMVKLRAIRR